MKKSLKNLLYCTGIGFLALTSSYGQVKEGKIVADVDLIKFSGGASLELVDLNNDNLTDLVTADAEHIKFYKNIGTKTNPKYETKGKIIAKVESPVLKGNIGIDTKDLNNDGKLDIVITTGEHIYYFPQK